MGLDISIRTDIDNLIFTPEYYKSELARKAKHKLSRTFCNLMCRKDVVEGEPELDQIGRITFIDISSFYEMESYPSDEAIEFSLTQAKDEAERKKITGEFQIQRSRLRDNLLKVQKLVEGLISKLSEFSLIHTFLNDNGFSTIDYNKYFTDFGVDKGDGYIGNNFGQDLRNFRRFLEFAKSKGAKTVYFDYG